MNKPFISFIFLLLLLIGCDSREYKYSQDNMIISSKQLGNESTTAGNLVTSAIRRVHKLDVVLYPREFIDTNKAGIYLESITKQNSNNILSIYPSDKRDEFRLGYMRGRNIKTFIRQRTLERFNVDFEVAGVTYDIINKGGIIVSEQYGFDNTNLDDDRSYLVAISNYLMRPGRIFPPYEFRNSIDRIFHETKIIVSARDSVSEFLAKEKMTPMLNSVRARVKHTKPKNWGLRAISEIQGDSFLSPYYGDMVTAEGIVTAFAVKSDAPSGYIAYIQSEKSDRNLRTSEAIKLFFEESPKLSVGDKVRVSGIVFEESTNRLNALTTTSIRKISKLTILSSGNSLPQSYSIKKIPQRNYSTYVGDLNQKSKLNLADAIDFWESLEGMRVSIKDPKVMGFRGGRETLDDPERELKRYLTLFVLPKTDAKKLMTDRGGLYTKPDQDIFNPDLLTIASGPLTQGLDVGGVYTVGDVISGDIEGIITYTKNLFGDGEYLFQIPQVSEALEEFNQSFLSTEMKALEDRPRLQASLSDKSLVIASYNIKNLSSVSADRTRLVKTGEMIQKNLSCPDILGLVEIQDNNGEDFSGSSDANKTIQDLINYIPKEGACANVSYESLNINPLSHREGGVPGANIRVALIYNKNRVEFKGRPAPTPLTETFILPNGHLNYNPGRVAPNSAAFRNTRKSIIAEFTFRDEPVFVIVNHFNSKISDTSHFSTVQPIIRNTEIKRIKMADTINNFVGMIELNNKNSNIAVIGDFNAYVNELPMKTLEGNLLYNLQRGLPRNEWYTTNHNGNSQSLDYIFVNNKLRSKLKTFQIPQINSDFMGRLSDHDPVISVFDF